MIGANSGYMPSMGIVELTSSHSGRGSILPSLAVAAAAAAAAAAFGVEKYLASPDSRYSPILDTLVR
eukprot:1185483-Prorocentrum_minimum.AAC.5